LRLPPVKRRRLIKFLSPDFTLPAKNKAYALAREVAKFLSVGRKEVATASARLLDAVEAQGLTRLVGLWLLALLAPSGRSRFINVVFRDWDAWTGSNLFSLWSIFRWTLPWLQNEHIDRLLEAARGFADDYDREEAIVRVLPRFSELYGCREALSLRGT